MSFDLNVRVIVGMNIEESAFPKKLKDFMIENGGILVTAGSDDTRVNITCRYTGDVGLIVRTINDFAGNYNIDGIKFELVDSDEEMIMGDVSHLLEDSGDDPVVIPDILKPADEEAIEHADGEDAYQGEYVKVPDTEEAPDDEEIDDEETDDENRE